MATYNKFKSTNFLGDVNINSYTGYNGNLVVSGITKLNDDLVISGNVILGNTLKFGTLSVNSTRVPIGEGAGENNMGMYAIAIGEKSGDFSQGLNSIAIGKYSGQTSQPASSIVISASGTALNGTTASSCYIKPIRNTIGSSTGKLMFYDTTSYEVQSANDILNTTTGLTINKSDVNINGNLYASGITNITGNGTILPNGSTTGNYLMWNGSSYISMGSSSISIYNSTGTTTNSIVLNASSSGLSATQNACFINPIRDASGTTTSKLLFWDTSTKEVKTTSDITNLLNNLNITKKSVNITGNLVCSGSFTGGSIIGTVSPLFSTDWFAVSANSSYTITHNLNIDITNLPVFVVLYRTTVTDPVSVAEIKDITNQGATASTDTGFHIKHSSANSILVRTATTYVSSQFITTTNTWENNSSGYYKIYIK